MRTRRLRLLRPIRKRTTRVEFRDHPLIEASRAGLFARPVFLRSVRIRAGALKWFFCARGASRIEYVHEPAVSPPESAAGDNPLRYHPTRVRDCRCGGPASY